MAVNSRIKIMVLCLLAAATPALAAPIDLSDVRVIDGHHSHPSQAARRSPRRFQRPRNRARRLHGGS
jgi:hypothetical protein